jgi:hypothetical protein
MAFERRDASSASSAKPGKDESGFCCLSVALGPERGRDHENDLFFVIDLVEKAVIPDAIPPRFGRISPQFFYVLSEIRLLSKLGINISSEFGGDFFLTIPEDFLQIVLELLGLEDPEVTQQTGLSACGPARVPPPVSSAGSHRT